MFLAVTDNGTNLLFWFSRTGVSGQFDQIGSVGRTAYMSGAPNQVGIMVDGVSVGATHRFGFDCFRMLAASAP